MNVQDIPEQGPPEVEQLVDALVDGKVAKYLLDTDTANELIKEIATESGLPRAAVRIVFKLLAPLLVRRGQAAAGWFGRRLVGANADLLVQLPGYSLIANKLLSIRAKFDTDVVRRQQLDRILAGERPAVEIEHAEGLSKELRVGLRQLADLQEMRAHFGDQFDRLLERLNPQPQLTPKLLSRDHANRLKFGARRVPFLGREAEMTRLRQFLESPGVLSWWLVTGPAGQGKSRLALELCLRAGTVWRTGFLPETSTFDSWDSWQPETATLMVVDYVSDPVRAKQIRRMIVSLLNREHTDPLQAPIRILILERSKERAWWNQLIGADQAGYAIEDFQFEKNPLDLAPMGEDDIFQIIVTIQHDAGRSPPDRAETLAALAKIDPDRRPLFAAFAADALLSTSNIRHWDRQQLLRDVLERERHHHWRPAGFAKPYEDLLCLATMTGGLPVTVLEAPPAGIPLPTHEEFDPNRYQIMMGGSSGTSDRETESRLAPLQPNILGEFFVLEHLQPSHPGTNQPAERFRHAAWNISIPVAASFMTFLDRAGGDFFDHKTLSLLVTPPTATSYQRHFWAMLAVDLINVYGVADRPDDAQRLFDLLRELAVDHPDQAEVQVCLAQGAYNMIHVYHEARRPDDARRSFDLLRRLEANSPNAARIRLRLLARGAVKLVAAYGEAGRPDDAQRLFDLAREFAAEHSIEGEDVSLQLAQAANNLIAAYASARRPDDAMVVCELLNDLMAHSNQVDTCLELCKGTVNLITAYGFAGRPDDAQRLFDLLRELAVDHPEPAGARLCLAKGAYNLITAYSNAGRPDDALGPFYILRELEANYPNEPEIGLRLAQSAFNLTTAYGNAHLGKAREVAQSAKAALISPAVASLLRERLGEQIATQVYQTIRALLPEGEW